MTKPSEVHSAQKMILPHLARYHLFENHQLDLNVHVICDPFPTRIYDTMPEGN